MNLRSYKCENCQEMFQTDIPEEDNKEEYKQIFGMEPTTEDLTVCHACWLEIMQAHGYTLEELGET